MQSGNKTETLQKIGDDFGITRERVRQIEREGINKLTDQAKEDKDLKIVLAQFKNHFQN